MKALKVIVIIFAVVIVVLVGLLIFAKPVQGPTVQGVVVTTPSAGGLISSPVAITGSVTGGGWFFEAVFPVKVLDGDGTVLGQGQAQATGTPGDWMSTGTVPFAANIAFSAPKYATGTILFEKDNPSGLPQNAGELRLPVRFR